jgi:hypothetical protein
MSGLGRSLSRGERLGPYEILEQIGADGKKMRVEVKAGPKIDTGVPKPLFDNRARGTLLGAGHDVANDGRFLVPVPVEQSGATPITVVINWTAGLKK